MFDNSIRRRRRGVNVPTTERIVTGGLGTAAVALGVRTAARGSIFGWLLAALGAMLSIRAAIGRSLAYRQLSRHRLPPFRG